MLDVDVKNGKDGRASLAKLGFANLAALSPVRVRTPSGGWHLFFAYDPALKNSAGAIGDGLDVRSEGGFVVAPGSFKGSGQYKLIGLPLGSVKLPRFPEKLVPAAASEHEPVNIVTDATEEQRAWAGVRA